MTPLGRELGAERQISQMTQTTNSRKQVSHRGTENGRKRIGMNRRGRKERKERTDERRSAAETRRTDGRE